MRLYRGVLRLYPALFRARFGDEMLQVYRTALAGGERPPVIGDALRSLPRAWWEEGTMRRYLPAIGCLVLAFGGAMMVVGNRAMMPVFLVGLLASIGLLYLVVTLASRRVHGAELDYSVRRLRWWWILAALIGAFESVFGVGQLIREPKGTNVFAMFVLLAFAALVFGGILLRDRRAGNWMISIGVAPMLPIFWVIGPTIAALVVIVAAMAENVRMGHPRPAV